MSTEQLLEQRQQERGKLLAVIVDLIKTDRRVAAAWLGGSLGRGNADRLSDIDIYIVITEAYARFVFSATREFVSRIPGVIQVEYDNANAPPDGAYLSTLYHANSGPHQVDWYWLTDKTAAIPANTVLLFNNAEIPPASMQLPTLEYDSAFVENEIARFWTLASITAKKIARGQPWSTIGMLGKLRAAADSIAWQVGAAESAPSHIDKRKHPPPNSASGQIALLQAIVDEMVALGPAMAAAGLSDPQFIAGELAPFIELARQIAMGGDAAG